MAVQKQDDQHERTYSSYVRIQVVVLKTCLGRWTIGRSGERGSGISVLPARYDDYDDDTVQLSKTFLLQDIQFSQTVLIQIIQFSISTQFSSIWPIDRTRSGATTPNQSGPGSDGNEGELCIPQSSGITGTSTSDCLVSYQDIRWGWILPLCRGAVGVFYSPSRLGWSKELRGRKRRKKDEKFWDEMT